MQSQSASAIEEILRNGRTIAVVGLSSNPARAVVQGCELHAGTRLSRDSCEPERNECLGEPAYPSLAAVPGTLIW